MAYGDFKGSGKTASDKILGDKVFNIAKNSKYDDFNVDLLQCSIDILIKELDVEQLNMRIFQTKNYLKNYTNQLLEHLRKEKYNHLLQAIFGVLISLICN